MHCSSRGIECRALPAGRCVILSCDGQRTMRTCFPDSSRFSVGVLQPRDFQGAKWVFLSSYSLYR